MFTVVDQKAWIVQNSRKEIPGYLDLTIRTQKTDGSVWSLLVDCVILNFSSAYLYGT